ncbi:UTP--glucose-1-phosphate uridylyltransferase [hydrothermal vent metagenome]|uniref:UTP--glucose-1-phosphate uridylyltransferase n=1 Tax=hydrothermal vent metagenome TaxID=652676 RepID=A0A3B1A281_9ZZZZ
MTKIKTAVFPVAGMGTRFLPATKANPKEMLPIVDKPLIQYAVEEAVSAGMTQMVFITGRNKRSIPDHFDKAYELESELEIKGKTALLDLVHNIIPKNVTCIYIRQSEPLGLGHAVLCAAPVVGKDAFAVILADDLISNRDNSCMQQLVNIHEQYEHSVLAVEEVPKEDTQKYGVIKPNLDITLSSNLFQLDGIVEKPKPEDAPSNLSVVGRYILTPKIFDLLRETQKGAGGEIQLTDAIEQLLQHEPVNAYQFDGQRFDCGSKLGYLEATVEYALQHSELAEDFRRYLESRFCKSE